MLRESDLIPLPDKNQEEVDRMVQSLSNRIDEIKNDRKKNIPDITLVSQETIDQGETNV